MKRPRWKDLRRVPASAVPEDLKKSGAYRLGGFYCRYCPYTTPKKGFSGRQALRAHMKVHARERRVWQRPLKWYFVMLVVAAGTVMASQLGVLQAPNPWVVTVPTWAFWAGFGIGMVAVAVALATSFDEPAPQEVWVVQVGALVGVSAMVWQAGTAVGFLQAGVPAWIGHVLWVSVLSGAWLAAVQGWAAYWLNRHWRSDRYGEIFQPRDRTAELTLRDRLRQRRRTSPKRRKP